jgi:glycosyltransferase involved in cell wall biosynthesis
MKVSVLVPVFNGERFLAECLDSILEQDFRDLEVLISDDGSTDGSPEIIKKYVARDARIRWWKNPRNLGLVANSNVCLKEAKGEYIKFVHQDDKLLSPSALRKMVAALDDHPGVSLAAGQQHFTGIPFTPLVLADQFHCFNGREMILSCFERGSANLMGAPSLTIFRRDKAQRGFDERFSDYMDLEMWFHLLEQGDFAYFPEPLGTWRRHSGQQSERNIESGSRHHELLLLISIYCEKPWFKEAATQIMVIQQTRFLKKKYGKEANEMVRKLRNIKPGGYVTFWVQRKIKKLKTWVNKTSSRFRQRTV